MISFCQSSFDLAYLQQFGPPGSQAHAGLQFLAGKVSADARWHQITEIAYFAATVAWETGRTFQPIEEHGSDSYFTRYDGRLGNDCAGDGLRYKGRGYVQVTGKANYRRMGMILIGIDLVNTPGRACEPDVAYEIAARGMIEGHFTGKKIGDYIDDRHANYIGARSIINGVPKGQTLPDHCQDIARIAGKFEQVLSHSVNAAL